MKFRSGRENVLEFHIILGFVCMMLITTVLFFLTYTFTTPRLPFTPFEMENIELHENQEGYLIKTLGCKIPDLPIITKDIEEYFEYKYERPHCNEDIPPLVQSNLTSLFLIKSSFATYNISDEHLLSCCYEELMRKIPDGQPDNQYEFGDVCSSFKESVEVKEEFLHVKCNYDDKIIYEDFFAFIPPKHDVTTFKINRNQYNVLIIGLDGVSRLNFHRQMKKTSKYLEELDFVEFLGYNKIADATYQNLIAILTGKTEETIDMTCKNSSKYFDNCSFIWDNFKAENFLTSFTEDAAHMGMFNYLKYGFQKQPTDYMWGFFDLISEKLLGNSKRMNIIQCIGSREVYKMFVEYIHDFVSKMHSWKVPYFGFFWGSSLSHDDLNKPRIGDEVYLNFLQTMYNKGYFENTVVVVMSDHGIRYGSYRKTYQGRLEERLPMLFVRLPNNFREKYPVATSNLKWNTRVLTTPFDLHETLYDLSSPNNLKDEFIEKQQQKSRIEYGLSLFQKIESTRTCKDVGIVDHWCTCLDSSPVEIDSKVIELANFTIDYMNEMLTDYAQCENLRLKEVSVARRLSHSEKTMETEVQIRDFLISFQTIPGDGLFEATVRQNGNETLEIVGTISRLNFYGEQSSCVTDFHLRLYCYCKKNMLV